MYLDTQCNPGVIKCILPRYIYVCFSIHLTSNKPKFESVRPSVRLFGHDSGNHFNTISRGVETVGPVSPVGHGHLRSDSRTFLSDQMSERTLKYLKSYFGYISACIGPTVKYDPWNRIRTLQTVHICSYLGDLGPFCTWKFIGKVRRNFSVWQS